MSIVSGAIGSFGVVNADTVNILNDSTALSWSQVNRHPDVRVSSGNQVAKLSTSNSGEKAVLGTVGYLIGTDADVWTLNINSGLTIQMGMALVTRDLSTLAPNSDHVSVQRNVTTASVAVLTLSTTGYLTIVYGGRTTTLDATLFIGQVMYPWLSDIGGDSIGFSATINRRHQMRFYFDADGIAVIDTTTADISTPLRFETGGQPVSLGDAPFAITSVVGTAPDDVKVIEGTNNLGLVVRDSTGNVEFDATVLADTIIEKTGGNGVDIEDINITDNVISHPTLINLVATDVQVNGVTIGGGGVDSHTTLERNELTPTVGDVIYNTNLQDLNMYNGTEWKHTVSKGDVHNTTAQFINTSWASIIDSTEASAWQSIAWSEEKQIFVAVASSGTNQLARSTDGINWTFVPAAETHTWETVSWTALTSTTGLFVAVASTGVANRVMTSPDGITWTSNASITGDVYSWVSVAGSAELGLFAAVSPSGRVMTSPDAGSTTAWVERVPSIGAKPWSSIAWSPELGMFAAVASTSGDVMTSIDGLAWVVQIPPAIGSSLQSITWASDLLLFVAVASVGATRVITSPDGTTWTAQTAAEANQWQSVSWSTELGLLIAVADDNTNRSMTSADGINWTAVAVPQANSFTGVAWSKSLNMFAAVSSDGTNRFMGLSGNQLTAESIAVDSITAPVANLTSVFSTDMTTDTIDLSGSTSGAITMKAAATTTPYDLTWPATVGALGTHLETDASGVLAWVAPPVATGGVDSYTTLLRNQIGAPAEGDVIYNLDLDDMNMYTGSKWKHTAIKGEIHNPTAQFIGLDWNSVVSAPMDATSWYQVIWVKETQQFVAVGASKTATSPDGETWTAITPPTGESWVDVAWSPDVVAGGILVSVSNVGSIMSSVDDGTTWVDYVFAPAPPAGTAWQSVVWSPELAIFCVVGGGTGTGYTVGTSTDGTTWAFQTLGIALQIPWSSMAWSPELGIFCAVSLNNTGIIMTSSDGLTWIIGPNLVQVSAWREIVWSPELALFCAVSQSGTDRAMTSPDGTTWTASDTITNGAFQGLTWSPELGLFIGVGNSGNTAYSPDGITWIERDASEANQWNGITWSPYLNKIVSVSSAGTNHTMAAAGSGLSATTVELKGSTSGVLVHKAAAATTDHELTWPATLGNAGDHLETDASGNLTWGTQPAKGLIEYTTLERNGLTPIEGDVIYNSDLNDINLYDGSKWKHTAIKGETFNPTTQFIASDWTVNATTVDDISAWKSITWSEDQSRFCAIGSGATGASYAMTSDDGEDWIIRTSLSTDSDWSSVVWGRTNPVTGLFVALAAADTTRLAVSSDGITWSAFALPYAQEWRSVEWSHELDIFVAVASSGANRAMWSSDGVNWTLSTTTLPELNSWTDVAWSAELGMFCAVAILGTNRVMTSIDGKEWTARTPSDDTSEWGAITWSAQLGLFCAVSRGTGASVMTSPDGITWTDRVSINDANEWWAIEWSPELGLFVALSQTGADNTMSSPDGIIWSAYGAVDGITWTGIAWSPELNMFASVADSGAINGLTAERISTSSGNQVATSALSLKGVTSGALTMKAAAATTDHTLTWPATLGGAGERLETDAAGVLTWGAIINDTDDIAQAVFSGDTSGSLTMKAAAITTDYDLTWPAAVGNAGEQLQTDASGNLSWVPIAAASGTIDVATTLLRNGLTPAEGVVIYNTDLDDLNMYDGANWRHTAIKGEIHNPVSQFITTDWADVNVEASSWKSVAWSPELGLFCAVANADTNRVMTSPDSITWTPVAVTTVSWEDITWSPELSLFCAVASTGGVRIMTSPDGAIWSYVSPPEAVQWSSVTWSPELGLFCAVARTGTNRIALSSDGAIWTYNTGSAVSAWESVAWSPELGLFCAIASSGTNRVIVSSNGSTWSAISVEASGWQSVAWSPDLGLFCAVAASDANRVLTSPDGSTWTPVAVDLNEWRSISWSPQLGLFCAVASSGTNRVMTSADGVNWSYTLVDANEWYGVSWSPALNKFAAVSSTGANRSISSSGNNLSSESSTLKGSTSGALTMKAAAATTDYGLTWPAAVGGAGERLETDAAGVLSWGAPVNGVDDIAQAVFNGATGGSLTMKAAAVTTNHTLTWPAAVGGAGERLETDATGVLSWGAIINDTDNITQAVFNGATGGSLTMKAAAVTVNHTLTWPAAVGNAGEHLQTDASGNLTWEPVAAVTGTIGVTTTLLRNGLTPAEGDVIYNTDMDDLNMYDGTRWKHTAIKGETHNPGAQFTATNWTPVAESSGGAMPWATAVWAPELGIFCAVGQGGGDQVMTSPDGITWTNRTQALTLSWQSVTWSPELGLFCAVAAGGASRVMTSPDGITWTGRTAAALISWQSVTWSPALGLFCAVASDGVVGTQIMTSLDGIIWTSRTSPEANSWQSVTWSPELGLFCAVSINGTNRVMTSPDGITWTGYLATEANAWTDVTWAPELGLFCAISQSGTNRVMTSPTGAAWTAYLAAEANTWNAIVWSTELGLFCAVAADGTNRVMTSTNGATWTSAVAAEGNQWNSIVWSPELNIFVSTSITGTNRVMVSSGNQLVASTASFTGATSGAITMKAAAVTTNHALTWPAALGNAGEQLQTDASGNLSWVPLIAASGGVDVHTTITRNGLTPTEGDVIYNTYTEDLEAYNGTRWKHTAMKDELINPITPLIIPKWSAIAQPESNAWKKITWASELGIFCAVSSSGTNRIMTSPDGITWTVRSTQSNLWAAIVWSPELGLFCIFSLLGQISTSPDGITWTPQVNPNSNSITAAAWSPELGLFAAVSENGTNRIITSPDGITWTERIQPEDNTWKAIVWSPELGMFCACSQSGTNRVMTSFDGITWTGRTPSANTWNTIEWSSELGLFCMLAISSNATATSPDGITWTSSADIEGNQWNSLSWASGLGLFYAIASTGTNRSATSPDGVNWTPHLASELNQWRGVAWSPELNMLAAVSQGGTNRIMITKGDNLVFSSTTLNGSTSGSLTMKAAAATTDYELTWPAAVGGAGDRLETDASGVLSWQPTSTATVLPGSTSGELTLEAAAVTTSHTLTWPAATGVNGQHLQTDSTGTLAWADTITQVDDPTSQVVQRPEWNYTVATSTMHEATYAESIDTYCAVGSSRIYTSTNGVNWTQQTNAISSTWIDVAWSPTIGSGMFVKIAASYAMYSPDAGVTWAASAPLVSASSWAAVAWSNKLEIFCAVGNGTTMTTSNGTTWVNSSTGVGAFAYNSIVWSPALAIFCAVGAGQNMISSDGISWTVGTATNSPSHVTWSHELGIFCGTHATLGVSTSTDGINWGARVLPDAGASTFTGITWAAERREFIAVGGTTVATSPDAVAWTIETVAGAGFRSVLWANNVTVNTSGSANGIYGQISYYGLVSESIDLNGSTSGTLRLQAAATTTDHTLTWPAAVGSAGERLETDATGALSWVTPATPLDDPTLNIVQYPDEWINYASTDLQDITYAESINTFCAVGAGAAGVYTSTDGITWTTRTPSTDITWRSIAWSPTVSGGRFVAVSNTVVMYSPDGITWTNSSAVSASTWKSVDWSPALQIFCAVGNSTTMTSSDGITWTDSADGVGANAYNMVKWSPDLGIFCAVLATKNMTSSDGVSWTVHDDAQAPDKLVWSPELNIFCGTSLFNTSTSPDGIAWVDTGQPDSTNTQWQGIDWSPELGLFLTVGITGGNGTAATSPDGSTWTLEVITNASPLRVAWSSTLLMWAFTNQSSKGIFTNNSEYGVIAEALELNGKTSGSLIMKAADVTIDHSLTWPATTGGTGYQLATDTTGALSWYNPHPLSYPARLIDDDWVEYSMPSGPWQDVVWAEEISLFVAVSFDTTNSIVSSPDGAMWTIRDNTTDEHRAVAWSPTLDGGKFVALATGEFGFMQSADGITWTRPVQTGIDDEAQWRDITWSPDLNIFVAVGQANANRVLTSADALTWTPVAEATHTWKSIVWSSDLTLFVAVAQDGGVMTSPDGSTWTIRTTAAANSWEEVTWSPELTLFVAVAQDGLIGDQIMTSPDGITWTSRSSTAVNNWKSVAWSADLGIFIAVATGGGNDLMTSSDGLVWDTDTTTGTNNWTSVIWAAGLGSFLTVSSNAQSAISSYNNIRADELSIITTTFRGKTSGEVIMKVPDVAIDHTLTWPASAGNVDNILQTDTSGVLSWVSGNETYISTAKLATTTWSAAAATEANSWNSVAWSPELTLFVAVAGDGTNRVMSSPDGVVWTARTAAQANVWNAVVWAPELTLFVAVSESGANRVMTSPDGITWTSRTAAQLNEWVDITWSPALSLFIAVANTGTNKLMSSPDGISWSAIGSMPTAAAFHSVVWAADIGLFCAVTTNGVVSQILISSDGVTWTLSTQPETNNWESVTWSPELGLLCAVSSTGTNRVMLSADGITWISAAAASASTWKSVTWSRELGLFCACALVGTFMTSHDGITWIAPDAQVAPEANNWESVIWSPELSKFVSVASSGTNRVTGSGGNSLKCSRFDVADSINLLASITSGTASQISQSPEYTADSASSFTVTRHNYIQLNNPVAANAGAGSLTVTDAPIFEFDASIANHASIDTATTKSSPGAVTAWIKININGVIHYMPAYSSKTS
jgi:hypothetical protein